MGRVRPGGAERWRNNASAASEAYKTGVQNPRKAWDVATKESEAAWKQGVNEAAAAGRFGKGVTKAGNSKWQERASNIGSSRFSQGVQSAQAQYESGVKPYLDVLQAIVLPPRYPKGDTRNIERVKAISEALRKKKLG